MGIQTNERPDGCRGVEPNLFGKLLLSKEVTKRPVINVAAPALLNSV